MKVRNLLMIFALIVSTSAACSSGSEAERADETAKTQEMAQVEEEAPEEEAAEEESQAADAEAEAGGEMAGEQGMMAHCPMAVENTEVAVENTDKGVAMVFTTTGDVAELRERVQWMAEHHGKMHGQGKMKGQGKMHGKKGQGMEGQGMEGKKGQGMEGQGKMHGKKGQGKMHGKKGHGMHSMMAKASVSAEEVDQGMKLVFTAEDDAQVEKLQQHMAQHVERVQSGTCPMKYNKSKDEPAVDES